jgi:hypothetical protein
MGRLTRLEKEEWERDNKATMHTVMIDRRPAWADGVQPNSLDDAVWPVRYRRGGSNGPATDNHSVLVKDKAELLKLMRMSDEELARHYPEAARPVRFLGTPAEDEIRAKGSKR